MTRALTGELIGTALLILLGDGVVANVLLRKTKGHAAGWIVITFGWAMAMFVGVLVSAGPRYAFSSLLEVGDVRYYLIGMEQ